MDTDRVVPSASVSRSAPTTADEVRRLYPAASHFVVVRDAPAPSAHGPAGTHFVLPVVSGNGDVVTSPTFVAGVVSIVDHLMSDSGDVALYMLVPVERRMYVQLVDALMEEELRYVDALNRRGADEVAEEIAHAERRMDIVDAYAPKSMKMEVFNARSR